MLALLLPIVLITLILYGLGSTVDVEFGKKPWQGGFLIAIALTGGLLVVIIEILGAFRLINQLWITLIWCMIAILLIIRGVQTGRLKRGLRKLWNGFSSWQNRYYVFLIILGLICILLFAVAVISPTNNVDSLLYHMPRVMQWAQNHSLEHFPVQKQLQNKNPYWAEVAILNFRMLSGNDNLANTVQWFAYIASIIAVTGIVALNNGRKNAQWFAAFVAASIPMAILQATSTQNDLVSAFWVITLAYFVVLSTKRELARVELFVLSLSLGLGMLTKGTFFPFAAILMVWFIFARIRTVGIRRTTIDGVIIGVIVFFINGPFWARNVITYGDPYGGRSSILTPALNTEGISPSGDPTHNSNENLGNQTNEDGQESISEENLFTKMFSGVQIHSLKLVRMIAMNFVSPFSFFNEAYFDLIRGAPTIFPPEYVQAIEWAAWNHEDTAGSPVHMVAIFIALIVSLIVWIRSKATVALHLAMALIGGYLLLSFVGASGNVLSIRYQLSFFILGAALIGVLSAKVDKRILSVGIFVFTLYAIPYLLFNNMRPVIGRTPWPTRIQSVFIADSEDILFAINPGIQDEYRFVTDVIKTSDCKNVGLAIYGGNLEYTFWWLLAAPQSGIRIRHVGVKDGSEDRLSPEFDACAIICTHCSGQMSYLGIPQKHDFGHVQLFMDR